MENNYNFYKFLNDTNEKILWEGYGDFGSFLLRNVVLSKIFWGIVLFSFIFLFFPVIFITIGCYCYFSHKYNTRAYYILTDKYAYIINKGKEYSCKSIPLSKGVKFNCKLSTCLGNTADFTFYTDNTKNHSDFNTITKNDIEKFVMQDIPNCSSVAEVLRWVLKKNSSSEEYSRNKRIALYGVMANILHKIVSESSNADLTVADVINNKNILQMKNNDIQILNSATSTPFVEEIVRQVEDGLDKVFDNKEIDYPLDVKTTIDEDYSVFKRNELDEIKLDLLNKRLEITKTVKTKKSSTFFDKIAKIFDDGKMQDEYDSKSEL